MRKPLRILDSCLIAALTFLALSCSPKVTVRHLDGQKLENDGPIYSLPISVIHVPMTVSQVTETPGKVWECGDELDKLGYDADSIKKIYQANEQIYNSGGKRITFEISDIQILVTAVPDPDHTYLIDLKSGFFDQKDTVIRLNELGNITGMDATVTDKTLEYAVTLLEVAAKIFVLGSKKIPPPPKPTCTYDKRAQARKAVNEILNLRKARKNLVMGTTGDGMDGEALTSMLAEIDKMEKQLIDVNFRPRKSKVEWKPVFEYTPEKDGDSVELFYITDTNCIRLPDGTTNQPNLDNLDEIEIPQSIDSRNSPCLNSDGSQTDKEHVYLTVNAPLHYKENMRLEEIKAAEYETSQEGNQGIVYRIPARSRVQIERSELTNDAQPKLIARSKPQIAQLGTEVTLPAQLGYGKSGYSLEFYDNTGSLKKVGAVSEPIPSSMITRSGAAAASIIDSAENKDIADLKRKNEETQLRINKIKLEAELKKLESEN